MRKDCSLLFQNSADTEPVKGLVVELKMDDIRFLFYRLFDDFVRNIAYLLADGRAYRASFLIQRESVIIRADEARLLIIPTD